MSRIVKKSIIIPIIVIVVALAGGGIVLYNHYHNASPTITTSQGKHITADPNVPGGSTSSPAEKHAGDTKPTGGIISSGPMKNSDESSKTKSPTISSSVQPVKPVGTFVNNHHPKSISSSMLSTCTTTPGANCKITFVKDGQTLQLPTQTTNSDGNTTWAWTPSSIGLSSGQWRVTAIASNGNKIASTADSMDLVVP